MKTVNVKLWLLLIGLVIVTAIPINCTSASPSLPVATGSRLEGQAVPLIGAKEHYVKGRQLILQNKSEEALPELKEAIKLAPEYYEAHTAYIGLMIELKRKNEVIAEYEPFLSANKDKAIAHCIKARLIDNLEEEKKELEKAIAIDHNFYYAYSALAHQFFAKKDYDNALSMAKKSLEINPNYDYGYGVLAQIYSEKTDYPLAIENYEKAVKANPLLTEAYINLMGCCIDIKDYDKTILNGNKVIEMDKRPLSQLFAYVNRGVAYINKNDQNQGVQDLTTAAEIAKKEKSAEMLSSIAIVFVHMEKYDTATVLLNQALEFNPSPNLAQQINAAIKDINIKQASVSEESIPAEVSESIDKVENEMLTKVMTQPDKETNLAEAVLVLSKKVYPKLDIAKYLKKLDEMAKELQTKIGNETEPEKIINLINDYLYKDKAMQVSSLSFSAGGEEGVVNIPQSVSKYFWLNEILDTNQGSCLGCSLLYLSLAERINLPIYGVAIPEHFFIRYDDGKLQRNIETQEQGKKYADDEYYRGNVFPLIKFSFKASNSYLNNLSKKEVLQFVLSMRGVNFSYKKKYDEAIDDFTKCIKLNPKMENAYVNRASTYACKGENDKAFSNNKQFLEIMPDSYYAPAIMNRIGIEYLIGSGVETDEKEVVKWFRKSAEQGYAQAQKNLGLVYQKGLGVDKDIKEAVNWFRKAAEQNNAEAKEALRQIEKAFPDIKQNEAKTIDELTKLAGQGDAESQYQLGLAYEKGEDVEFDAKKSVKWYRKAAEQGHAQAQYCLGSAYQFGIGVTQNEEEAVKWLTKSAQQGNKDAINALEIIKEKKK